MEMTFIWCLRYISVKVDKYQADKSCYGSLVSIRFTRVELRGLFMKTGALIDDPYLVFLIYRVAAQRI